MRASNGRQDVAQGASLMRKIEGHGWPGFCSNNVGRIAQSVEQRTENPCVGGSIPPSATTSNFPPNTRKTLSILYFFFFISGASALLYQLFWQRMLFNQLGTDLASIIVIVSVFMFGLGLGALAGGKFTEFFPHHLIISYLVIELSIALFGIFSPNIIASLDSFSFSNNIFITIILSFLILIFPTTLMGATFPILVRYVDHFNTHIGRSVGELYFANTLGGAFGAYLAGFVLLYVMELSSAIYFSVFLNLLVAILTLIFLKKQKS